MKDVSGNYSKSKRDHSSCVRQSETPLIYVLRNDLGLKGAKFGCGLGQCGACKILMDGQAVPSCRISVESAQGREITTIEGLGTSDDLHPLQKAFIEEQAVECGFCVPGMIIAAKALLDRNPCPTDAEIRAEMSGNLCRCGVHDRVVRAIKRAAGQPVKLPLYEERDKGAGELLPESSSPPLSKACHHLLRRHPILTRGFESTQMAPLPSLPGRLSWARTSEPLWP